MSGRVYRIIFFLLSIGVVSVILLQGFWMVNFYRQKTDDFNREIYSVLEQVGAKLQDRENMKALRHTYIIQNGDTIVKTPSKSMKFTSEGNHTVHKNGGEVVILETNERRSNGISDSFLIIKRDQNVNIVLQKKR